MVVVVFSVICLILIILLLSIIVFMKNGGNNFKSQEHLKILFVTAHPDDECMFFAPTILNLCAANHLVHLLCLSNGNFYNFGYKREKEFKDSCKILNINENRTFLIDNGNLKDNPSCSWSSTFVSDIVNSYVIKHHINTLITFDEYGVSGHMNHISTHLGVRKLLGKGNIPGLKLYELKSIGILRKYLSFADIMFTDFGSGFIFHCSRGQFKKALCAMLAHSSQMTWYRWLYIIFSRYMIINELKLVEN